MLLNNSHFHLPYNQKLVAKVKELRKNATIPEKKHGKTPTYKSKGNYEGG